MNIQSIAFQLISFIYVSIIAIIFLLKKKVKNTDVVLYTLLLIVTLLNIIFDILSIYAIIYMDNNSILQMIICKTYLVSISVWIELMSEYVYLTVLGNDNIMVKKYWIFIVILVLTTCITYYLPIELRNDSIGVYSRGMGVIFQYFIYIACAISWFILVLVMLFKDKDSKVRAEKKKKLIPIFIFFFVGGAASIIQFFNPGILLVSTVESIICILMFHTIENPDIEMMKQLAYAKDQADKANIAKSEFLSSMSHEIRTPLNAIIGFSNFIMDSNTLKEAKEQAKDVVSASETLLETVNGILDISKVESGKLEIIDDNYNLYDMLDSTVKMAKARMGDKDLKFNVDIQKDLPKSLYGDKTNVSKVIINLLTNAIKYTEKGSIDYTVNGTKENDKVNLVISVKDTGIGIKTDDIDKLFTRFQRLDDKKTNSIEGTGLGLAITKQLVEMMNGEIVVTSEYGKGSTFKVTISQKISDVEVASENEVKTQETSKYDFNDKKVLVVDDNNLNLKLASKLFLKYNCTITTAKSGFECIDLIENGNKYDIIFLDDVMPNMLGSETLTKIKKLEGFNTPVVALTANAIEGVREKYLSLGFDEYLAKPIEKNKLEDILVKFLVNKKEIKDISSKMINSSEHIGVISSNVSEKILKSAASKEKNKSSKGGEKMDNNIETNEETIEMPKERITSAPAASSVEGAISEVPEVEYTDYSDKKVLIVDDNKLNLKVAVKFMSRYKFNCEEAYSGEECIQKIKDGNKYDIIFMDIMMPTLSGVETFHQLQGIDGFNTPVVVALTADAVEGAKEKYLSEGFAEYISKPIVREHLDYVVHEILDKKEN